MKVKSRIERYVPEKSLNLVVCYDKIFLSA